MITTNDKQSTKTDTRSPQKGPPVETNDDEVQGEGDYRSAREFNELEHSFVESGKVDSAARAAAPKSESEEREMLDAEQKGKRRSKGEDPTVKTTSVDSSSSKSPAAKVDR